MIAGLIVFCVAACCLVCYRVSLVLHPYTQCKKCDGNGRNPGSTRTRFGKCRACKGAGRKERWGRRFLRINSDR